jgi:hypothetical protein
LGLDRACEVYECIRPPREGIESQYTNITAEIILNNNYPECMDLYEEIGILYGDDFKKILNKYDLSENDKNILSSRYGKNSHSLLYWLLNVNYLEQVSTPALCIELDESSYIQYEGCYNGWCTPEGGGFSYRCLFVSQEDLNKNKVTLETLNSVVDGNRELLLELANITASAAIKANDIYEKNDEFNVCNIMEDLEDGIATPLEITFQPDTPTFPLKMSSINEGNTKINVYFISDYNVSDSSGFLSVKGKDRMGWGQYILNEYVDDYLTWMSFEGSTSSLTDDAYFVSID